MHSLGQKEQESPLLSLLETYHKALQLGKQCLYIDLVHVKDGSYENCSCAGYYVFIDNAQRLRKDKLVHIPAMLGYAKVYLAYSPVDDEGGITCLKSPVQYDVLLVKFVPFTPTELQLYLQKHQPGSTYDRETTLPIVVKRYLAGEKTDKCYLEVVSFTVRDTFGRITKKLSCKESGAASLLATLYSFCLRKGHHCDVGTLGLVYSMGTEHKFVFDTKLVFLELTKTARQLYKTYDIGGAMEFLFTQVCMYGPINPRCFESRALTIIGRVDKPGEINLTCSNRGIIAQPSIGCNVVAPEGECSLIKINWLRIILFNSGQVTCRCCCKNTVLYSSK